MAAEPEPPVDLPVDRSVDRSGDLVVDPLVGRPAGGRRGVAAEAARPARADEGQRPTPAVRADARGDSAATGAPAGRPPSGRAPADPAATDPPPVAYGVGAALGFVERLARVDHAAVRDAVAAWRESMRHDAEAWFAAEEAVARAVVASGRQHQQRPLLIHVADVFAHQVWDGGGPPLAPDGAAPELRVQATEASGQYLGMLAMLALLVGDHLEPATFALLYRPFAALVPPADLGRG
jgi:hypothetical protein